MATIKGAQEMPLMQLLSGNAELLPVSISVIFLTQFLCSGQQQPHLIL